MAGSPWLRFGDRVITYEEIPELLERSNLLNSLFRQLIVEQCCAGIDVSAEDQTAFQRRFLAQNQLDSPDALSNWLAERGLTEEQASKNILTSLQLQRFKESAFASDIEKTFLDTKELRDRVVYSLLRVQDSHVAVELHFRLQEGDATFTDLCEEHSLGPERETGGLIGPVALGTLHPDLAALLRASTPGKLWPPRQIDGYWVILRLDKFHPARLDDEMRRFLIEEQFESWMSSQLDAILDSYRKTQQQSSASDHS